jgi:hypothetical protein
MAESFCFCRNWENTIEVPTSCLDYANYRFGGSFQESTVDNFALVGEKKLRQRLTCIL